MGEPEQAGEATGAEAPREASPAVPTDGAVRGRRASAPGGQAVDPLRPGDRRLADLFGPALPQIERYAELLTREGVRRGLIGPREVDRLWERHLVNCGAVATLLPATGTLVDVGSGAGLPGIVLGAMRPDLEVVLLEPMERRVTWLTEVIDQLGLDSVRLVRGRAEELHGSCVADAVTARAVAPMERLARWTLPLLRQGGVLLAMKGGRAAEELAAAVGVIADAGGGSGEVIEVIPDGLPGTNVVRVVRTAEAVEQDAGLGNGRVGGRGSRRVAPAGSARRKGVRGTQVKGSRSGGGGSAARTDPTSGGRPSRDRPSGDAQGRDRQGGDHARRAGRERAARGRGVLDARRDGESRRAEVTDGVGGSEGRGGGRVGGSGDAGGSGGAKGSGRAEGSGRADEHRRTNFGHATGSGGPGRAGGSAWRADDQRGTGYRERGKPSGGADGAVHDLPDEDERR